MGREYLGTAYFIPAATEWNLTALTILMPRNRYPKRRRLLTASLFADGHERYSDRYRRDLRIIRTAIQGVDAVNRRLETGAARI